MLGPQKPPKRKFEDDDLAYFRRVRFRDSALDVMNHPPLPHSSLNKQNGPLRNPYFGKVLSIPEDTSVSGSISEPFLTCLDIFRNLGMEKEDHVERRRY